MDFPYPCDWPLILRGTISAWDAIVDSEYELGVAGTVNFTVVFNATEKVDAKGLAKCYFLRYPEGCSNYHELRNIWLAANNHKENEYKDEYVLHNNLGESFTNRWVHSISSAMSSEDVRQHVQEFYSYINPVHENPARVLAEYPA